LYVTGDLYRMNDIAVIVWYRKCRNILISLGGLIIIVQLMVAEIDDSEFFNSLNLHYPGLEKVAAALATGDTSQAKEELLVYYRSRTSVSYFDLPSGGDIAQADENINNYFTIVGIKLFAGKDEGTIDWSTSYPGDSEWHWQFHRMPWLVNLARVYGRTNDEKYAERWVAHLVDWATNNSAGYPRSLDTGNRIRNWVESYQYMVYEYTSPSIHAEEHFIILKSLVSQVRNLRDNWRSHSNWGASETRGMIEVVVMFPEFTFYPEDTHQDWIDIVQYRLTYHLEQNFLDDGVQYETSPMYHYLTYRNLLVSYELMVRNEISVSEGMHELFIKPAEVLMHITRPDGFIPQLADSDRTDRHLYYLGRAATAFNREDFRYVASRGQSGTVPKEIFAAFPDGGIITTRTGWDFSQNDKYLLLHYGSNQPWHAHYDILNIEIFANGRPVVIDPGRYTYSDSEGWRDYFKNSTAHNTVVIDGKNQDQNARGQAQWISTPDYVYIHAFHDAYRSVNSTLLHNRKILFVKPHYWIVSDFLTGTGSHSYDLYFHADPLYRRHHVFNNETGVFSTPDYAIIPADSNYESSVDFGWVSYEYGEKTQAPVIKYRQQGSLPVTFESLIIPLHRGESVPLVSQFACYDESNIPITSEAVFGLGLQFSDICDAVSFNHNHDGPITFHNTTYDGDAAWIRIDGDNIIKRYFLKSGKSLYVGDMMLVLIEEGHASVAMTDTSVFLTGMGFNSFTLWSPQTENVYVNGNKVSVIRSGEYVSGVVSPSSIARNNQEKYRYVVFQNYPNPFNATTVITYQLEERSDVTLRVYDILGRHVITLIDSIQDAGEYSESFDGTGLPSGVYFFRITSGEYSTTHKMMLVQ
jgi:hypothetical protein